MAVKPKRRSRRGLRLLTSSYRRSSAYAHLFSSCKVQHALRRPPTASSRMHSACEAAYFSQMPHASSATCTLCNSPISIMSAFPSCHPAHTVFSYAASPGVCTSALLQLLITTRFSDYGIQSSLCASRNIQLSKLHSHRSLCQSSQSR